MYAEAENEIIAEGAIEMKNKEGNSIIESLSFGQEIIMFMTDYFVGIEQE